MAQQVTPQPDWRDVPVKYNRFFFEMTTGVVLVLIGVLIGIVLLGNDRGYTTNLYTEGLSIAATVFILNLLARRREDARLKAQLIRELGSSDNGIASRAARELEAHGWLNDGSLKKVYLANANLRRVNLLRPDLEGADLTDVNCEAASVQYGTLRASSLYGSNLTHSTLMSVDLRGADLSEANLEGANLFACILEDAKLGFANLSGAQLNYTNFQNANLEGAKLQGADLRQANLEGAKLVGNDYIDPNKYGNYFTLSNKTLRDFSFEELRQIDELSNEAEFDENTLLPDGAFWTPDIDMKRFTDPSHPDFWRSDRQFT